MGPRSKSGWIPLDTSELPSLCLGCLNQFLFRVMINLCSAFKLYMVVRSFEYDLNSSTMNNFAFGFNSNCYQNHTFWLIEYCFSYVNCNTYIWN